MVTYSSVVWLEAEDAALIKQDEEITLMYWGNCIIRNITKNGDTVTALYVQCGFFFFFFSFTFF